MDLKGVCGRIRELKIQGAENVAFAALRAFSSFASKVKASNKGAFVKSLESAKAELFATRPTEPMMRNFIRYAIRKVEECDSGKVSDLKGVVRDSVRTLTENNREDTARLNGFGAGVIRDGASVFTHCHSSTVVDVFRSAYGKKKFSVYCTETRPLFQGRKTAKELAGLKIPVVQTVDSGALAAISKCSAVFIGADAISADGSVVNKVGSAMFAMVAASRNIPVYVCSHSWKFDPDTGLKGEEIEQRDPKEVWPKAPPGVKVLNPAFDVIDKRHITAIVSELGVLWPDDFVRQVKRSFYLGDSSRV